MITKEYNQGFQDENWRKNETLQIFVPTLIDHIMLNFHAS